MLNISECVSFPHSHPLYVNRANMCSTNLHIFTWYRINAANLEPYFVNLNVNFQNIVLLSVVLRLTVINANILRGSHRPILRQWMHLHIVKPLSHLASCISAENARQQILCQCVFHFWQTKVLSISNRKIGLQIGGTKAADGW